MAGPTGLGVVGQGQGRCVAAAEHRIGQDRNGARRRPWTGLDRTGTARGGGQGQDRTGQGWRVAAAETGQEKRGCGKMLLFEKGDKQVVV